MADLVTDMPVVWPSTGYATGYASGYTAGLGAGMEVGGSLAEVWNIDWLAETPTNLLPAPSTFTDSEGVDVDIATNGGTGLATLEINATDGIRATGPGAGDNSTMLIWSASQICTALGLAAWNPLDRWFMVHYFKDVSIGGDFAKIDQLGENQGASGSGYSIVSNAQRVGTKGFLVRMIGYDGLDIERTVQASALTEFRMGTYIHGNEHLLGAQAGVMAEPTAMTPVEAACLTWNLTKTIGSNTGDVDDLTDTRFWLILGRSVAGQLDAKLQRSILYRGRHVM
jgi:hypothetical protein